MAVPELDMYPGSVSSPGSYWPELYISNSNFLALNSMLFVVTHSYTFSRSACSPWTSLLPWIWHPIRVSLAKLERNDVATSPSMSYENQEKQRAQHRALACGTPEATGQAADLQQCCQSAEKLPNMRSKSEWDYKMRSYNSALSTIRNVTQILWRWKFYPKMN